MRHAETVTFGGGGLNRDEDLRRHPEHLEALPARTLPIWRGKVLMNADRSGLATMDGHAFAELGTPVFVGQVDGIALFTRDVSDLAVSGVDATMGQFLDPSEQTHPDLPTGTAFAELRAIMTRLTPLDAEIAATAKGVLEWHRSHGFCANCGAATTPGKAGWMRACDTCGRAHFPRTDPVVIMLITRGDKVLVGRSPAWPEGFFSCLAGFMEPGETMEAAVRREVWEETGVHVGPVTYLASQPWPFPGSLMLGAHGEATSDEINIDPEEIAEAIWMDRSEMLDVFAGTHPRVTPAREGAIARFLLENWLADRLT
ncbi:MAG: NAD(+) diphosphatase [Jannaschia sp.]